MRPLSLQLFNAQRAPFVKPYVRLDLGGTVYDNKDYLVQSVGAGNSSGNSATVILDNSKRTFSGTDYRGTKVALGWGIDLGLGTTDEYSNDPDMYVDRQYDISIQGKLYTVLECIDNWERLNRRRVMGDTIAASYNTETAGAGDTALTVKEITEEQLDALSLVLNVDSSDGQEDTVEPDLVYEVTATRRQVILDVIKYTENLLRMRSSDLHMIHNNASQQHRLTGTLTGELTAGETVTGSVSGATGEVVYQSVASGAGYLVIEAETGTWETSENAAGATYACNSISAIDEHDYVYELVGGHTFYENTRALSCLPANRIIVVDALPDTEGTNHTWISDPNADDEADQTDQGIVTQVWEFPNVESNDECTAIAESILAFYQAQALQGELEAPMNCGQEVYDLIKIEDQRAGFTGASALTRRVGSITRMYAPSVYKMYLGFGGADWGMPAMAEKLGAIFKDSSMKEITDDEPKASTMLKKAFGGRIAGSKTPDIFPMDSITWLARQNPWNLMMSMLMGTGEFRSMAMGNIIKHYSELGLGPAGVGGIPIAGGLGGYTGIEPSLQEKWQQQALEFLGGGLSVDDWEFESKSSKLFKGDKDAELGWGFGEDEGGKGTEGGW